MPTSAATQKAAITDAIAARIADRESQLTGGLRANLLAATTGAIPDGAPPTKAVDTMLATLGPLIKLRAESDVLSVLMTRITPKELTAS